MTNIYMKYIYILKTIWEHNEKKKSEDGRAKILPSFKPCPFGKGITLI
jgi:hypothetical protein